MNEILMQLNTLSADELESVIERAKIMAELKRKEEAEFRRQEEERRRQEQAEQERRRQEEIAELQRRLRELQGQAPAAPAPQPEPVKPEPVYTAPVQPEPVYTAPVYAAPEAPKPAPQPAYVPPVAPAQPAPQETGAQVKYADESMEKWVLLPGEKEILDSLDVEFSMPALDKDMAYVMTLTDQRILLSRQSAAAHRAKRNAGIGFGLIGSLITSSIVGKPKPWLEIPLTAVTNCGPMGKKEFFFEADQTYVINNKVVAKRLPELVAQAKK